MKNRVLMLLLAAALCFGGAACGQGNRESKTTTNQEEQQGDADDKEQQTLEEDKKHTADDASDAEVKEDDGKKDEEKDEDKDAEQAETKPETEEGQTEQQKQVTVYYSDAEADGFETTDVTLEQLTPEALIAVLSTKGVLPADVQVNSFKETDADGGKAIDLDLSAGFGTYLRSMGTSGEYIVMGSICNTFLEAYDCEKIHITVDGEKVETGHAEYPGYLSKFQ